MNELTFIELTKRYRFYKSVNQEPKLEVRKFTVGKNEKNYYFLKLTTKYNLEFSKSYTEKYFNSMIVKFLKINKLPY